jgi:uncharacterized membrane-anchored protein
VNIDFKTRSPRRVWIAAIVVALLQTLVLGRMIESRAAILVSGTEVLLKTAPVDPRDLLRGDYVALNYDISSVPLSTLNGGLPPLAVNKVLFVRLQRQPDGFWGVVESSFSPLPARDDTVLLQTQPLSYQPLEGEQAIRVDYGIERYYLPEGRGHDLEGAPMNGRISVAVRVAPNGASQIRSLMLDGKAVYEEPLY